MRVGGHPAFQERGRCRVLQPAFRPAAIPLPELPIPLLSFGVPAREEVVESVEVKSLALKTRADLRAWNGCSTLFTGKQYGIYKATSSDNGLAWNRIRTMVRSWRWSRL